MYLLERTKVSVIYLFVVRGTNLFSECGYLCVYGSWPIYASGKSAFSFVAKRLQCCSVSASGCVCFSHGSNLGNVYVTFTFSHQVIFLYEAARSIAQHAWTLLIVSSKWWKRQRSCEFPECVCGGGAHWSLRLCCWWACTTVPSEATFSAWTGMNLKYLQRLSYQWQFATKWPSVPSLCTLADSEGWITPLPSWWSS